ncbi:helix-turn-helix transcriptional regulator [Paraclostridium ghonii]|uniref:Transcriptional regulator n=1 Tax=Paraclostridium ghonii TaxID=29358 RepID=A0ABU0MZW0_9FIRM|nr:helix-turn-helix transcriptional regulator [Paeniclostridium ghonii]MDQ0556454.1 putative transcriptional regulator [Paeniclostridium ghonii]
MSGTNLKIARIKKGLTQRQLVEISGVGLTSITKIEKYGIENTTVATLRKLAYALDTSVEELFFNEE